MPFLAAGAGIGAVGSMVGGGKQASATRDAAKTQADAATHAADLTHSQYVDTVAHETPFINTGYGALDQINGNLGSLTASFDPTKYGLGQTYDPAADGLSKKFSYDPTSFQNDPAFQSAMKLSQQAVERSAAAKGQVLDPSTLKSLTQYATDYGNQYYNQDYNRAQDTYNQNFQRAQGLYDTNYARAFNTFTGNQSNAFNKLSSLASLGQNAATQTGSMGAQAATAQGNALMSAGNSSSAGIIGGANAFNSGMAGVSANLMNLFSNPQFQSWAKGGTTGNNSNSSSSYTDGFGGIKF